LRRGRGAPSELLKRIKGHNEKNEKGGGKATGEEEQNATRVEKNFLPISVNAESV